ncbi:MAG: DUF427 domain-containing protein [Geodermatophilaceae bacterium]|nr:DUF427 domain-containing protein [Geodermatophilaceae bacterium]
MPARPPRVEPGPGQESVWDYPRPPSLTRVERHVVVRFGGQIVADATSVWRVRETSHPPAYYLEPEDFAAGVLSPGTGSSFCEFKGSASYWTLSAGGVTVADVGWSYEDPSPAFAPMRGAVSLYPGRVDEVLIDDERVRPQSGGFYGGWITDEVVGPFKGEPGTRFW